MFLIRSRDQMFEIETFTGIRCCFRASLLGWRMFPKWWWKIKSCKLSTCNFSSKQLWNFLDNRNEISSSKKNFDSLMKNCQSVRYVGSPNRRNNKQVFVRHVVFPLAFSFGSNVYFKILCVFVKERKEHKETTTTRWADRLLVFPHISQH